MPKIKESDERLYNTPERKQMAMLLLADRCSCREAAKQVGVSYMTVCRWRDSVEGEAFLKAARQARVDAFKTAIDDARALLNERIMTAAQVLVDSLYAPAAADRNRAALALLDRCGMYVRSELPTTEEHDFSAMTPEQRLQFSELCALVKPKT